MDTETFVQTVNKIRLQNKDKWYVFTGTVNGKSVQVKGYKTWLEVLNVDGIRYWSRIDATVTEFKSTLERAVS